MANDLQRRSVFEKLVLLLFAVAFSFGSVDTWRATDETLVVNAFLFESVYRRSFFSIFEILTIAVAIGLIYRSGVHFRHSGRTGIFIFASAIVCFVLDVLNPNNEFRSDLLLIAFRHDMSVYPFLLFLGALLFIDANSLRRFLTKMAILLIVLAAIRSSVLLVRWFLGEGNYAFFGVNSTITEGDTLRVIGFLLFVTLVLYIIKRKRKYLVVSIIFGTVLILSFRRQSLLTVLIAAVVSLIWYSYAYRRIGLLGKLVAIGALLVLVVSQTPVGDSLAASTNVYLERYFGMFLGTRSEYGGDTGHFAESYLTLRHAVEKASFWGYGVTEEANIYVPGASNDFIVHNVYAATWLYRGLYLTGFYLALVIIVAILLLRTIRTRRKYKKEDVFLYGSVAIFFLVSAVAWIFSPIGAVESLKMKIFWITLVVYLARIAPRELTTEESSNKGDRRS